MSSMERRIGLLMESLEKLQSFLLVLVNYWIRDGITAFVIEKGTQGFTAGKKENKLGMRASETCEMVFDNCRVHKDQILGKEGERDSFKP
jgi:hypothetical protein